MTRTRNYRYRTMLALLLILGAVFLASPRAEAYTLTPVTWNMIGLDSNDVNVGPSLFPVGAKVCGGTDGAAVDVYFAWLSSNSFINLRPGSKGDGTPLNVTFGADGCADAFFEAEVTRNAAAYGTSRQYRIYTGADSTPVPRELYVERLISQARNSITNVTVDGVSVPAGGSMNLIVGNTYTIKLFGGTATQGYNQFTSFFTLSNTIFQILSVSSTYSANDSPYVPATINGSPYTGIYADACLWENDPGSPNYRSCIGGDYKAGGTNVTATYVIKIISGGGTSLTLSSMLFDFSGASYHYNGDYSTSARIVGIIDPASAGIAKAFSPATTNVGGVSTLTFTLTNPNAGAVSGLGFTDVFPVSPGAMTLYDTVTTNTCGGTLTSNSGGPLAAGSPGIRLSGATVSANSSCIVQVNVTPAATGTYTNTSQNLLVNTLDTGKSATATLTVNTTPPPPSPPTACTTPQVLARWTMDTSQGTGTPPLFSFKEVDVSTATASYTSGGGSTQTVGGAEGAPVNSWYSPGWAATATGFPNATAAPYFQFDLDTSKYGDVRILSSYYIGNGGWAAPANNFLYIYSSADGGAYSNILNYNLPKGSWQAIPAYPAATTGSATTSFRVNAVGARTLTEQMYIDNIVFTGCPVPNPPAITKSFATNPVAVGGTSVLTFTITNPNSCCTLSGIAFSDVLPLNSLQGTVAVSNGSPAVTGTGTAFSAQLVAGSVVYINKAAYTVATITSDTMLTLAANYAGTTAGGLTVTSGLTLSGAAPSTTCTVGTVTTTADAATGATVISLAGGSIPAGAGTTCTVTATVKDSIAGPVNNVSGAVSSTDSGTNSGASGVAKAALTAILPPAISKQFAPDLILSGGTSTLTFLVTNPNQNNALSGVAFSDGPFPATMAVATPASFSTSGCGTPTFTPVAAANSISFSGGTIAPGGTCTVTVNVTATATGTSTSGAVSAATAGTGNTATDTLTITPAHPEISMFKEIATSAGPPTASTVWSSYLALPAGGPVWYQLQIQNDGDVPLNNLVVADDKQPAALAACAWQDGDGVAIPSLAAYTLQVANNVNNQDFATCLIGPFAAAAGTVVNTVTVQGNYNAATYTDFDSAAYATTSLTLAKSATESFFKAGDTLHYSYLVTNSGNATLNGPMSVTDDKATVACPPLNTIGNLNNYLDPGEALTCTAAYAVTAADVTTGSITNTATASTPPGGNIGGSASNAASKTLPLAIPPTITKSILPATIEANVNAVLTFTLDNPNAAATLTNCVITDTFDALVYPDGLIVGSSPTVGGSCAGVVSTPDPLLHKSKSLTLTVPTLGPGSCTVTVPITGSEAGSFTNTASPLVCAEISSLAGSGPIPLTVTKQAITFTKGASLANIPSGGTITYTMQYGNPNSFEKLTGIVITDDTPKYTSFLGAACTLPHPASITDCQVTSSPVVGGKGTVTWTLTGTLDPGSTGTVTLSVSVD